LLGKFKRQVGEGSIERERSVREVNKRYRNKGEIERVGDWIRGKLEIGGEENKGQIGRGWRWN
jgi:hypothetical protein